MVIINLFAARFASIDAQSLTLEREQMRPNAFVVQYIDNERDEETFLSSASFDDVGRRLLTGDHAGMLCLML